MKPMTALLATENEKKSMWSMCLFTSHLLDRYSKHDAVQSNAAPTAPANFDARCAFLVTSDGNSEAENCLVRKRAASAGCDLAALCRRRIASSVSSSSSVVDVDPRLSSTIGVSPLLGCRTPNPSSRFASPPPRRENAASPWFVFSLAAFTGPLVAPCRSRHFLAASNLARMPGPYTCDAPPSFEFAFPARFTNISYASRSSAKVVSPPSSPVCVCFAPAAAVSGCKALAFSLNDFFTSSKDASTDTPNTFAAF